MSKRAAFVDCFYRLRKLWEVDVERRLVIAYAMDLVARRVGNGFYVRWRAVVWDFAEFWGPCDAPGDVLRRCITCGMRRECWKMVAEARELIREVCGL